MKVSKVFVVLITVVLCVMIGAFTLNKLYPNVVSGMSSAVEGMVYNATGISLDFNGDGKAGKTNANGSYGATKTTDGSNNADKSGQGVQGFK